MCIYCIYLFFLSRAILECRGFFRLATSRPLGERSERFFFFKSMDFLFLVFRIALTVQCIFLFKEHTAPFPRFSHLVRALCSSLSVSAKSQI